MCFVAGLDVRVVAAGVPACRDSTSFLTRYPKPTGTEACGCHDMNIRPDVAASAQPMPASVFWRGPVSRRAAVRRETDPPSIPARCYRLTPLKTPHDTPSVSVEASREKFQSYLSEKGLRVTNQRLAIFDAAFAQKEHFTAEGLLDHARRIDDSVSRATVYRTLPLMTESHLLREVDIRIGREICTCPRPRAAPRWPRWSAWIARQDLRNQRALHGVVRQHGFVETGAQARVAAAAGQRAMYRLPLHRPLPEPHKEEIAWPANPNMIRPSTSRFL